MALQNNRHWYLAAALSAISSLCLAADLMPETRYAGITVGNSVATISQIGSNNNTRVDQSGGAQRLVQSQVGHLNQAAINQGGVSNSTSVQQAGLNNGLEINAIFNEQTIFYATHAFNKLQLGSLELVNCLWISNA